jgi:outer membrane autotransporter protein
MTKTSKKSLLLGVSAAAVVMSVALSPNLAMAAWGSVTNTPGAVTSSAVNEHLNITGAGDVTEADIAAIVGAGHTGLKITINTNDATKGIRATGGNMAVNGATADGHIDEVTVTKGIITTDQAAKIALSLGGVAGNIAITVGANGSITNTDSTAAAGTAIKVSDADGAQTLTITNAGTISTSSTGPTAIAIDLTAMTKAGSTSTITNTGTISAGTSGYAIKAGDAKLTLTNSGTITGLVNLGTNAGSSFTFSAGTISKGVTMGNAAQTFTVSGNTLGLGATLDGPGQLIVEGTGFTVTGKIGDTTALTSITIDDNKSMTASGTVAATTITIGSGATFTSGEITGAVEGPGKLTLDTTGGIASGGTIGATTSLSEVATSGNAKLTVAHALKATQFTIADGTTIQVDANGSLTGNIEGSLANKGTLIFNRTDAVSSTGTIGATNSLAKFSVQNAGTYTANHAIKTAATAIDGAATTLNINAAGSELGTITPTGDQGILNFNANYTNTADFGARAAQINIANSTFTTGKAFIATDITIKDGGTVKLTADVNSGNSDVVVNSGGTFNVGEKKYDIGTGSFTAQKGSTYSFMLTGAGDATTPTENVGRIVVASGAVTFEDGANFTVDSGGLLVVDGHKYIVAKGSAAATVNGKMSKDYGLVSYALTEDTNNVIATATVKKMEAVTGIQGTHREGVASAIQNVMKGSSSTATQLLALQNYSAEQLVTAVKTFDQATNTSAVQTSASIVSGAQAAIDINAGSSSTVVADLLGAPALSGQAVAAGNVVPSAAAVGARGLQAWGQLTGATEEQSRRESTDGYKGDTVGFTMGVTGHIMDGFKAGMAFTYADSKIKESLNNGKTDVKNYMLSLYGAFSPLNTWFVDGIFTGGSSKHEGKRVDLFDTTYSAEFGGSSFSGMVKGGWNVKVGDGMVISPFVAIKGGTTSLNAYTETGGDAPMSVGSNRVNSMQAGLGSRVAMSTGAVDGWTLSPQFNVSWMHEFSNKSRTVNAVWVGEAMQVKSPKMASEIITGGVGLKADSETGATVSLDYTCTAKSSFVGHTGMLRVGYNF